MTNPPQGKGGGGLTTVTVADLDSSIKVLELVGTSTAGGNVAGITLDNLSIDLDDYDIYYEFRLDKDATSHAIAIFLNGDTTGSNYNTQLNQMATSILVTQANDSIVQVTIAAAREILIFGWIRKQQAIDLPTIQFTNNEEAPRTMSGMITKASALTDNIVTELEVVSSFEDPFLIGSELKVYKRLR